MPISGGHGACADDGWFWSPGGVVASPAAIDCTSATFDFGVTTAVTSLQFENVFSGHRAALFQWAGSKERDGPWAPLATFVYNTSQLIGGVPKYQPGCVQGACREKTGSGADGGHSKCGEFRYHGNLMPPASTCKDLYRAGVRADGVYYVWPTEVDTPFDVYCDMRAGGWTIFMLSSAGGMTPNLLATSLDPQGTATYAYMARPAFLAIAKLGSRVRAWAVAHPHHYIDCGLTSVGSGSGWYKSWSASERCFSSGFDSEVASLGGLWTTSITRGFEYSDHYDTINPSMGHSVFTKANQAGCCAGTPPGWVAWPGSSFSTDFGDRLVYAIQ